MLMKFKVTKEVLAKSVDKTKRGYIDVCAIAMAMKKRYPNIHVGVNGATLDKVKGGPYVPFPEKVSDYVTSFDQATDKERLELPEFEFELDIPE